MLPYKGVIVAAEVVAIGTTTGTTIEVVEDTVGVGLSTAGGVSNSDTKGGRFSSDDNRSGATYVRRTFSINASRPSRKEFSSYGTTSYESFGVASRTADVSGVDSTVSDTGDSSMYITHTKNVRKRETTTTSKSRVRGMYPLYYNTRGGFAPTGVSTFLILPVLQSIFLPV
ncbi:hypothetical protein IPH92_02820 [Candidatus Kaiserbacteria bacterium]|nr:MAG: hypothetical protein IPH92_02820 [Candidatus Kaiserbacteria bacterium]